MLRLIHVDMIYMLHTACLFIIKNSAKHKTEIESKREFKRHYFYTHCHKKLFCQITRKMSREHILRYSTKNFLPRMVHLKHSLLI